MPRPRFNPYDWQTPAIAQQTAALRTNGSALNASDTGTGKTVMACATFRDLGVRPIIVAPPVTHPGWRRTLAAFGLNPIAVVSWEKLQRGLPGLVDLRYCTHVKYDIQVPNGQPWTRLYFMGYGAQSTLRAPGGMWRITPGKMLLTWTPDDAKEPAPKVPTVALLTADGAMIPVTVSEGKKDRRLTHNEWTLPDNAVVGADEFHKAGADTSINSKMMVSCPRVLALSATVANNPIKMKAIGTRLRLFAAPDYYAWLFAHGCKKGYFGGFEFVEDRREAVLRKLHAEIFPARGCRVRWQDVPNFPGTTILPEIYERENLSPEDKRIIDRLAVLEAKAADDQAQDKPEITLLLREREYLETLKLPILVDLANAALDNGKSVVIFTSFRYSLTWLGSTLGGDSKISLIWGEQTHAERERNVRNFQTNATRICIAQVGAGGVGVDLHDVTGKWPREALICPTFSVVELRQALGRVHRATALTPSLQRIVYLANTVEEKICRVVKAKLDNLDLLNDGDVHNVILNHLTEKE